MRVGLGYDAHRLVEERPLILGGVTIPYEKGLLGHSDADVLTHAVCDAVLGAVGMGDLGKHFPDTEDRFKGIASLKLLAEVQKKAEQKGWSCINVDAVIIAQKPKLAAYMDAMKINIARVLQLTMDAVNIKATTTEGMGFEGTGQGISAQAVV
ncbi:MAG: 2-C-methyl-D-erythritol 2,4-cyclodiphosphate synthase, partial [Pseudomonadota bacterium]